MADHAVVDMESGGHKRHHKSHKSKKKSHHKSSRRSLSPGSDGSTDDSRHRHKSTSHSKSHHNMKAVSSRFGTLDLEDSEPIPTRPALSPADDRIVLNGRKLKDSSTRMPDSALKSTRSKKSMRAAKQSRRALLPDDDRSTKTAPRGGAFANSLRHLARSLRGGNANAVRPSHSPQSHKRGWCGLRPAAVILTTLICCALIAAIVVIVVLTTGDDTPAVVYKKHGRFSVLAPCLCLVTRCVTVADRGVTNRRSVHWIGPVLAFGFGRVAAQV